MYVHTCIHTYIQANIRAHGIYVHIYIHTYVHTYVCVSVCMYKPSMYVYIYIYIYTYNIHMYNKPVMEMTTHLAAFMTLSDIVILAGGLSFPAQSTHSFPWCKICACMYIYVCVCVCMYVCICMCICTYANTCGCECAYDYMRMYAYMYVCIYEQPSSEKDTFQCIVVYILYIERYVSMHRGV